MEAADQLVARRKPAGVRNGGSKNQLGPLGAAADGRSDAAAVGANGVPGSRRADLLGRTLARVHVERNASSRGLRAPAVQRGGQVADFDDWRRLSALAP